MPLTRARRARDRRRARRRRGQPPRRRCCGTCWRRSRVATAESRARYCVDGACRARATCVRDPELADGIERLAARRRRAVLHGRHRRARCRTGCVERGGTLTRADLAAYAVIAREPVRVRYHGREVLTNPPPSAGGAAARLRARAARARARQAGRGRAGRRDGGRPGRAHARLPRRTSTRRASSRRSWARGSARRRTSSVLDADGWACAVTTTNGEGSGIVVPGTGIHVNNMMGEQDLSPGGLVHAPARAAGCRR